MPNSNLRPACQFNPPCAVPIQVIADDHNQSNNNPGVLKAPDKTPDFAVGDGSTAAFTGAAYMAPFKYGMVCVTYDSGIDAWPAGMWVEFCCSCERKDELDELIITLVP